MVDNTLQLTINQKAFQFSAAFCGFLFLLFQIGKEKTMSTEKQHFHLPLKL